MILAALVCGAMIWEYRNITLAADPDNDRTEVPILIGAVVGGVIVSHFYGYPVGLRWLLWSLVAAALADFVFGRRRAMGWGILGGSYIGLAGIGFLYLRGLEPLGFATALWVIMVVVAADVGGYFAGRIIGGPKLWPRVSPKKTWAGSIGGIVLAVVCGGLFAAVAVAGAGFWGPAVISAVVAVVSQAGDLAESALKRHFGVKDSGVILPGHGGALDRFDGLIAAAIGVEIVTWLHGGAVFIW